MPRDTTVPNLDELRVWWTIGVVVAVVPLDFLSLFAFGYSSIANGIVMGIEIAAMIYVWRAPDPFPWRRGRSRPS